MVTDEMLTKGLSLTQADAQHDLKAGFRCRLLSAFDESAGGEGKRRRTKLAILAVEKVLPLWEAMLPTDETPRQAMDVANRLLAGVIALKDAETELGRLWTHCDDLSWRHADNQSVIMVGYGAVQAIREAMSQKHFGCEGVNDGNTDIDIDPYDHDSAFCAAIAYCGGPPWDEKTDAEKRLEFWKWWLTSAVRTALTVV
jgi:hypothetical protein